MMRYTHAMGSSTRYDYLSDPRYNKATDACPECEAPSKTHYNGSRTATGDDGNRVKITRWTCEHQHNWSVAEPV